MDQSRRDVTWTVIGTVVLFGGFVASVWRAGFLSFSGGEPSAKVVAAALTLIGAFIAAVATLLGILFKQSFDRRTETRMALESARNAALARESEDRLKLEAAIQALQLFGTSSGTPTLPVQRAGALFMLASLGQHELALTLLDQSFRSSEIDPDAATTILDHIFSHGTEAARESAANFVYYNVAKLTTPAGPCFPTELMDGCVGQSPYVRTLALAALGDLLLVRSVAEWRGSIYQFNAVVSALALLWYSADDGEKADVGSILNVVLRVLKLEPYIDHPARRIDIAELRAATKDAMPSGGLIEQVIAKLRTWSALA
jgi:hypothetical protein